MDSLFTLQDVETEIVSVTARINRTAMDSVHQEGLRAHLMVLEQLAIKQRRYVQPSAHQIEQIRAAEAKLSRVLAEHARISRLGAGDALREVERRLQLLRDEIADLKLQARPTANKTYGCLMRKFKALRKQRDKSYADGDDQRLEQLSVRVEAEAKRLCELVEEMSVRTREHRGHIEHAVIQEFGATVMKHFRRFQGLQGALAKRLGNGAMKSEFRTVPGRGMICIRPSWCVLAIGCPKCETKLVGLRRSSLLVKTL